MDEQEGNHGQKNNVQSRKHDFCRQENREVVGISKQFDRKRFKRDVRMSIISRISNRILRQCLRWMQVFTVLEKNNIQEDILKIMKYGVELT